MNNAGVESERLPVETHVDIQKMPKALVRLMSFGTFIQADGLVDIIPFGENQSERDAVFICWRGTNLAK